MRSSIALGIILLQFLPSPSSAMDGARKALNVDQALLDFHVSGKGVLVAIMDRGIDWQNNDFRNVDGTTRIEAIFDLTDDSGKNDQSNPFKIGTIYTKEQIDGALKSGKPIPHRDAVGHGTTTTAIACGSGRNLESRKYRGIAPEASIISVKICSDGANAHTDQEAEAAFYDGSRIPVGIDFIRKKAIELGRPCVMVLNIGSQGGPTDGTSRLCRKIDETVGPHAPGLIFVSGPGDDGGRNNRASGIVKQDADEVIRIVKDSTDDVILDLWYSDKDQIDVSVRSLGKLFGPFEGPTKPDQRKSNSDETFQLLQNSGSARFFGPSNSKNEVYLKLRGPKGNYELSLHGRQISNGRFDATINPNAPTPTRAPFNRFESHTVPGSIWDGATARHNICPGDYVIRNQTVDLQGRKYNRKDEGEIGDLWKGCSIGPTFDGRIGIDFCVPADIVYTTYNPKSAWAQATWNLAQDGQGMYGSASAVSAANPMAAGVIALMLELDPELDALAAKRILQQSSVKDRFTGETPNYRWGYGKLNAHRALQLTKENRKAKP
jgi:minor extracellular serine protease Vpr